MASVLQRIHHQIQAVIKQRIAGALSGRPREAAKTHPLYTRAKSVGLPTISARPPNLAQLPMYLIQVLQESFNLSILSPLLSTTPVALANPTPDMILSNPGKSELNRYLQIVSNRPILRPPSSCYHWISSSTARLLHIGR